MSKKNKKRCRKCRKKFVLTEINRIKVAYSYTSKKSKWWMCHDCVYDIIDFIHCGMSYDEIMKKAREHNKKEELIIKHMPLTAEEKKHPLSGHTCKDCCQPVPRCTCLG